ncbi:hypothetical protein NMY22_g18224 [Coprinellus aureogranulatus]|nr:hypothetical protein NMY22_g18224 [Coprinellus aureogranulatus]
MSNEDVAKDKRLKGWMPKLTRPGSSSGRTSSSGGTAFPYPTAGDTLPPSSGGLSLGEDDAPASCRSKEAQLVRPPPTFQMLASLLQGVTVAYPHSPLFVLSTRIRG